MATAGLRSRPAASPSPRSPIGPRASRIDPRTRAIRTTRTRTRRPRANRPRTRRTTRPRPRARRPTARSPAPPTTRTPTGRSPRRVTLPRRRPTPDRDDVSRRPTRKPRPASRRPRRRPSVTTETKTTTATKTAAATKTSAATKTRAKTPAKTTTATKSPTPSDDAPSPSVPPERTAPGIASALSGTVDRITEPVAKPKAESAAVASAGTPSSGVATLDTATTELRSAVETVIEPTGASSPSPSGRYVPVVQAATDRSAEPVVETEASGVRSRRLGHLDVDTPPQPHRTRPPRFRSVVETSSGLDIVDGPLLGAVAPVTQTIAPAVVAVAEPVTRRRQHRSVSHRHPILDRPSGGRHRGRPVLGALAPVPVRDAVARHRPRRHPSSTRSHRSSTPSPTSPIQSSTQSPRSLGNLDAPVLDTVVSVVGSVTDQAEPVLDVVAPVISALQPVAHTVPDLTGPVGGTSAPIVEPVIDPTRPAALPSAPTVVAAPITVAAGVPAATVVAAAVATTERVAGGTAVLLMTAGDRASMADPSLVPPVVSTGPSGLGMAGLPRAERSSFGSGTSPSERGATSRRSGPDQRPLPSDPRNPRRASRAAVAVAVHPGRRAEAERPLQHSSTPRPHPRRPRWAR